MTRLLSLALAFVCSACTCNNVVVEAPPDSRAAGGTAVGAGTAVGGTAMAGGTAMGLVKRAGAETRAEAAGVAGTTRASSAAPPRFGHVYERQLRSMRWPHPDVLPGSDVHGTGRGLQRGHGMRRVWWIWAAVLLQRLVHRREHRVQPGLVRPMRCTQSALLSR